VCETEVLPGYTQRATDFEKAVYLTAAYSLYSGAAHAELYAISQSWRQSATATPLLERSHERIAVWAAVLAAAGFATVPAFSALQLFGKSSRNQEVASCMRRIGQMCRDMDLPRDWQLLGHPTTVSQVRRGRTSRPPRRSGSPGGRPSAGGRHPLRETECPHVELSQRAPSAAQRRGRAT